MKSKATIILLMLFIASTTLCYSAEKPDIISSEASSKGKDYFPMTKDSVWHYDYITDFFGTWIKTEYFKVRVSNAGKNKARMTDYLEEQEDGQTQIGIWHNWMSVKSGKVLRDKYRYLKGTAWIYSNGYLLLPSLIEVGHTESVSGKLSGEDLLSDYSTEVTVEAFETITVPAGVFETVRVKRFVTQGTSSPLTQIRWYAEGIGLVKSYSVDPYGMSKRLELKSYTIK